MGAWVVLAIMQGPAFSHPAPCFWSEAEAWMPGLASEADDRAAQGQCTCVEAEFMA